VIGNHHFGLFNDFWDNNFVHLNEVGFF
jgi:hypothetical protein